MARALRDQQWREGAHTVDHTHQLHVDEPAPCLGSLFPSRRLLTHHAGVVADEVDAAEPFHCLVGERVEVGVDADIGPYPGRVAGQAGKRIDSDGDRFLTDVGDHHVHTAPH